MKPCYKDLHNTLYCMDFRKNDLPDACVQVVCTSPPYWGLRKYSGKQELIWGDNHCEHQWGNLLPKGGRIKRPQDHDPKYPQTIENFTGEGVSSFCSLCGAWKGAYGLEPTPEMYVQHTIEILREIRRVLRKDGVVFWNIGDSYYGQPAGNTGKCDNAWQRPSRTAAWKANKPQGGSKILKPKDLCLIPFRIAIAAQEDGWWVRSVIIWSKPNPMPESVTDRPTESHEYILMLAKSARYYWDADAVREQQLPQSIARMTRSHFTNYDPHYPNQPAQKLHFGEKLSEEEAENMGGRNIRTVWEFPTQPYPEAHFAVFPEKLPELCIKAATPEVGCCSKCGAPWTRITKPTKEYAEILAKSKGDDWFPRVTHNGYGKSRHSTNESAEYETIGWQPTCKCNADKAPSIVLDPFAGAGTTLWVAKKLNRRAVGYEISQEYCDLAIKRNLQQVLL